MEEKPHVIQTQTLTALLRFTSGEETVGNFGQPIADVDADLYLMNIIIHIHFFNLDDNSYFYFNRCIKMLMLKIIK